jgi:hypothetical protein
MGLDIVLLLSDLPVRVRLPPSWQWRFDNWELENLMRTEMIRKFQELSSSHEQYELKQKIFRRVMRPLEQMRSCSREAYEGSADFQGKNRMQLLWNEFRLCTYPSESDAVEPMAIGLQTDGDEILSGVLFTCTYSLHVFYLILFMHILCMRDAAKTLYHLKHCTLANPLLSARIPMVSFKGSMTCLHDEGPSGFVGVTPESLDRFSWIAPGFSPLARFLAGNDTFRGTLGSSHSNAAGGVHLSSIADPVEVWFKSIGVQHGMENVQMRRVFPVWLIRAGLKGEITHAMVRSVSGGHNMCSKHKNSRLEMTSVLPKEDQDVIARSLPWALQHNPKRYPFVSGAYS